MSAVAVTGIGATIVACGAGGFEITNLTLTGNARSHLQVGDRIMSVGSVVTTGKTYSEVKALILGPAGSTITMEVARGHVSKLISFRRNSALGAAPAPPTGAAVAAPAASSALSRPLLGLTIVPAQGSSGAKIESVTPGGLAATTGLLRGDVILSIGAAKLFSMPHVNAISAPAAIKAGNVHDEPIVIRRSGVIVQLNLGNHSSFLRRMASSSQGGVSNPRFQIVASAKNSSGKTWPPVCLFSTETFSYSFLLSLDSFECSGDVIDDQNIVAEWYRVPKHKEKKKYKPFNRPSPDSGLSKRPAVISKGDLGTNPPTPALVRWDKDSAVAEIEVKGLKVVQGAFEKQEIAICFFSASPSGQKNPQKLIGSVEINLSEYVAEDKPQGTCEDATVESKDTTLRVHLKLTCQRSKSPKDSPSQQKTATKDSPSQQKSTSIVDKLPGEHMVMKETKFPDICTFTAILTYGILPDNMDNWFVHIISDPAHKLCIGAELEISEEDTPNSFGIFRGCRDIEGKSEKCLYVQPKNVVYLPCKHQCMDPSSSISMWTQVIHVFHGNMYQCEQRRRQKAKELVVCLIRDLISDAIGPRAKRDHELQIKSIRDLKIKSIAKATESFSLCTEELCMVYLRQGFVISQPILSHIVEQLMCIMFKDRHEREKTCISFFGSASGPWDIFNIFIFLLRPKTFVTLVKAACEHASLASENDTDYARERLVEIIYDIFEVRNMWAHVGATDADCKKALHSIVDFINFIKDFLSPWILSFRSSDEHLRRDLVGIRKPEN